MEDSFLARVFPRPAAPSSAAGGSSSSSSAAGAGPEAYPRQGRWRRPWTKRQLATAAGLSSLPPRHRGGGHAAPRCRGGARAYAEAFCEEDGDGRIILVLGQCTEYSMGDKMVYRC